ncbi:hypothetical protein AB0F43_05125 [Kribbella sp. NPDC023972]|uniref:hypothetical protein n=1 Tax=Kribbella sp. NPDC023972 TaxID=3154795 RepID=UPI0033ECDD27
MDERDRSPAPGYLPAVFQTTAVELDQATATDPRGRGNLLGLVFVVGLFAFFVTDALPGGPNAVAAFAIAAGVVLLLFLGAVTAAVIIRRTRRPASTPARTVDVRAMRPPRYSASTRLAPAEVEEPPRPATPGSKRDFLRTVDELLSAIDRLPEDQVEWIEHDLLRFATSGSLADLDRLAASRVAWRMYYEVDTFVWLAGHLTEQQLAYLSSVLTARGELR